MFIHSLTVFQSKEMPIVKFVHLFVDASQNVFQACEDKWQSPPAEAPWMAIDANKSGLLEL